MSGAHDGSPQPRGKAGQGDRGHDVPARAEAEAAAAEAAEAAAAEAAAAEAAEAAEGELVDDGDLANGAGQGKGDGRANGDGQGLLDVEDAELVDGDGQAVAAAGSAPEGGKPGDPFTLNMSDDLSGLEALLSDDFARISAEREEYLDALKRLQADFDNFRKRTERQQSELRVRASETLVVRLLPVLDSLELAIGHLGLGDSPPADEASTSLLQVNNQLRDILAREGLERIDAVGVRFDPTVHEATAMDDSEPSEQATDDSGPAEGAEPAQPAGPTVTEVWRSGYRMADRVIRPAMVRVRG